MKKYISILLTISVIFFLKAKPVLADFCVVSSSGQIVGQQTADVSLDMREVYLTRFLQKYNSPLLPYTNNFIASADKYNLDWRLLPAITGVESTFGKRIPYNSFNAYGWANGKYYFNSWEESIGHVSKTLREKYYDRGATNIALVARRYAPPSLTWAGNVKWFMNKIDPIPVEFTL